MLFAILAAAAISLSQSQPTAPVPEIVVTGERTPLAETVHAFVTHVSLAYEGQLARFHDPVCPHVIGVAPEFGRAMVARLREVAAASHIRVAGERCSPNLTVVLDRNPCAFVAQLRRSRPDLFAGLTSLQVRRLTASTAPAVSWNATEIQNEDGRGSAALSSSLATMQGLARLQNPDGLDVRTSSIIHSQTQRAVLSAFVVIDGDAAMGKSLIQIADYAAVRGLAPVGNEAAIPGGADTILRLFGPAGNVPGHLSALDLAYLVALYRAAPNRSSLQQNAQIDRIILEQLAGSR